MFLYFKPLFVCQRPLLNTEIIDFAMVIQMFWNMELKALLFIPFFIKIESLYYMFDPVSE